MKLFFILSVLLAAPSTRAATLDPAEVNRVATSTYWRRLLHFHGSKSDVDGEKFFLSPQGRRDPKAELLATIAAFETGDKKVGREADKLQHPLCAFPERARFLTQELKLIFPRVPCPLYDEYLAKFKPEGTTLVFSAAYPYNPGSMFGHTFLRINSQQTTADGKAAKKMDLLDHGLSYAANVGNDDNSIGFMWNGLTGGFTGNFTVLPYYQKVNEYNNSESRDLWEYELDLNAEQTSRLLAHTWELEMNGTFNYFFFTANCSYQLLGLLEVARPDWDLTSGWWSVIPSETVKRVVDTPGAVRRVNFRASLYKKAILRIRNLDDSQRANYEALLDGSNLATTDTTALASAISFFYYKKQKNNGHLSEADQIRFEKILIARSKVKESDPPEPAVPPTSRPDLGHYAYRVGTAAGLMQRGAGPSRYFQDLHFRPAYHDLLNDDRGFTPFSEIVLGSLVLRTVPGERNFIFEEFKVASIVSLSPWTAMEKPISWKFLAGYLPVKDLGCPLQENCNVGHFEIGAGLSAFLDEGQHALVYSLFKFQAQVGAALPRKFRTNQGGEAGFLWNPLPSLKAELSAQSYLDLFTSRQEKLITQAKAQLSQSLGHSFDVRASFFQNIPFKNAALRHRESQLGVNLYF